MVKLVKPVIEPLLPSIALMKSGRRRLGFGIVVSKDGKILTRRSSIRLGMSIEVGDTIHKDFTTIGILKEADLAVVKVDADDLQVAEFSDAVPVKGEWLFTPTLDKTIALLGTMSESIHQQEPARPLLGVMVLDKKTGTDSKVPVVDSIIPNSAAARSGIRRGDLIKAISGKSTESREELAAELTSYSSGQLVTLLLDRDGMKISKGVVLGANRDLGKRRRFTMAFGHDTVLREEDCGGPIIDLEGRVVGINVSDLYRGMLGSPLLTENRTSILCKAIPAKFVKLQIEALTDGRLAPSVVNQELLEHNAANIKLKESELAKLAASDERFRIYRDSQEFLKLGEQARATKIEKNRKEKANMQLLKRELAKLNKKQNELMAGRH